jgi:hypothetical protein
MFTLVSFDTCVTITPGKMKNIYTTSESSLMFSSMQLSAQDED